VAYGRFSAVCGGREVSRAEPHTQRYDNGHSFFSMSEEQENRYVEWKEFKKLQEEDYDNHTVYEYIYVHWILRKSWNEACQVGEEKASLDV
jgi:hypothetical protein